jgi:hypothetical protein
LAEPLTAAAAAGRQPVNELRVPVELLRSRIASAGVPTDPGRAGEASYLQRAYESMLSMAGTSFIELRLARGADQQTRQALAARLGVTLYGPPGTPDERPDQLDALTLLRPEQLTEVELERLFGLPDTTVGLDPLRTVPRAQLQSWQLETQTSSWQTEDLAPAAAPGYGAVVDPDVITAGDVRGDTPLRPRILQLLQDRAAELTGQEQALQTALAAGADPRAMLAALLAAGLPGRPATVLTDWQVAETAGADIGAELSAAGLDRAGYTYLIRLQTLAATATTVTGAEWDTAVEVLTGAYRRRGYPAWRTQESGIVLSPDVFTGTADAPPISSYRISPRARTDWVNTLATRGIRREDLLQSSAAMIVAAEQAALPILRDALLADVAATVPGDPGEFLSGLFQVDFRASGAITTTRLAQATASLQTLLDLVRSGDVSADSAARSWTLSRASNLFDTAWDWLDDIGSWRHATTAFFFPEAALDPALLDPGTDPTAGTSPEFATFAAAVLKLPGDVTPADVLEAADTYCAAESGWLADAGVPNPGPLSYLSSRNRDHQALLAGWSKALQTSNQRPAAREIFWAVPMLAGRRLTAAGHYQEALDWFWVAFPYNDPAAVSGYARINDEVRDAPKPPDLTFPPNWPADLNPFHLAEGRPAPYLRTTLLTIAQCLLAYGDVEFTADDDASLGHARSLYLRAAALLAHPRLTPVAPAGPGEAALEILQLSTLRGRAATQLAKLRQGRNIAGLPRTLTGTGGGGPALRQPTPYHFRILLTRAQQLTQQAAQIEAQYLSLLEKHDAGTLKLNDAAFAAGLAELQTKVHDARVQQAADATAAAGTQKAKAGTMAAQYQAALDAPPNRYESDLLDQYKTLRGLQDVVSVAGSAIGIAQAAREAASVDKEILSFGANAGFAGAEIAGYGAKATAEVVINNLQAQMNANQLRAGIETRRQETAIQRASAGQDVLVAAAQQTVARDQQDIALAEQAVAAAQNQQAKVTLALLRTQFTNPDLYLWMSDTIGGVYRYFLQQATATARLAQAQLAFERAEPGQALIAADYWTTPAGGSGKPAGTDTKGMTGAERLAQDLTRLDEYAFSTDTRRLNLSQSFSLAQMLPTDFLQFRRTGQLSFATPMSWFDRDFPGHYQRLIRQVRLSLVALVPPDRGVRASLSNTGISRVSTTGAFGSFTDVVLRRDPQTVSVTSALNASGVFELDLQPEMLLPFEGSGVDTQWQFTLPLAANPFDFDGVADILLRIDYTALDDADYRALLVHRFNTHREARSDCVFNLARDFPDQWYELNNPDPVGGHAAVTLTLARNAFPFALEQLATTAVAVGLSTRSPEPLPEARVTLHRSIGGTTVGGAADTTAAVASTRRGASTWAPLSGVDPTGDWQLELRSTDGSAFPTEQLDDLVMIISWRGDGPAWPL